MSQTLKDRIKAQIRIDGPLPVSLYMQLALHDRQHGYYATRPGLMKDFATAPEISQVFGELIGEDNDSGVKGIVHQADVLMSSDFGKVWVTGKAASKAPTIAE